ncbi:MAG TPA: hypothetical protein VFB77_16630 [Acidimicrobiales bacterium]|nr:hypothetical protein [Acidimicrobiales bacterium]
MSALARSPWPVRVVWLALPLVAGPAIAGALADASSPVRWVAGAGAWAGWVVALVAALVPSTVSLTVLRVAAPAALAATVSAVVAGTGPTAGIVSVAAGVVVTLVVLAPETAEVFVDGSSYGDERRLPLRTPAPLLAGPVELAWLAVVAPGVGAVLLAAGQWVAGALVVAAGVPLAVLGARSLHSLARRWLVFVPAGLVVHDALALAEPVLFRRQTIRSLAAAAAGTTAFDLTAGAAGLAVELALTAPVALVPAARRGTPAELTEAEAVFFTPSRPGRVLAEARRRRIR